jgi:mRNA interferase MazF
MQQLDIYWAKLDPVEGSEQAGVRPVVIISGNTMNDNLSIAIACPITSQIKNYPGSVPLKANTTNNLTTDSEVIVFQVRTVSKSRLQKKIGAISVQDLTHIFEALGDVLKY